MLYCLDCGKVCLNELVVGLRSFLSRLILNEGFVDGAALEQKLSVGGTQAIGTTDDSVLRVKMSSIRSPEEIDAG